MKRFVYFVITLSFISCSGIEISEPTQESKRESIFGGPLKFSTETGSFSTGNNSLSGLTNSKDNSQLSSLPINELLWRSSLDTLEFMSFEKIDPFGGIIVSGSNGVEHYSGPTPEAAWIGGRKHEVGNPSGSRSLFDGLIDDMRIYDRALSAAEVQALYNLGQ